MKAKLFMAGLYHFSAWSARRFSAAPSATLQHCRNRIDLLDNYQQFKEKLHYSADTMTLLKPHPVDGDAGIRAFIKSSLIREVAVYS